MRNASVALRAELFEKRTRDHIARVQKNLLLMAGYMNADLPDLEERARVHDESKFSADFSLVATLIDGEVNLANSTPSFLKRSDVQSLLARTVYVEKPAGYEANHADGFVRVTTRSGQVYQEDITREKGELATYEDIRTKFHACAAPVVGDEQARRIDSLVGELEGLKSVSMLVGLLQPGAHSKDSVRT